MKDKIAPEKIVKELVKKDLNKWKYVFAQFSSEFEDTSIIKLLTISF